MANNLPSGPPTWQRALVATVAIVAGAWITKDFSRNYELVKFTPFPEEEVEKRKRENNYWNVKQLDTCTLEYTPEAKAKLEKLAQEKKDT